MRLASRPNSLRPRVARVATLLLLPSFLFAGCNDEPPAGSPDAAAEVSEWDVSDGGPTSQDAGCSQCSPADAWPQDGSTADDGRDWTSLEVHEEDLHCTPQCDGRQCGDNGCGGTCEPGCSGRDGCVDGLCVPPDCLLEGYRCEDDTLIRCEPGDREETDCSAEGRICAWSLPENRYACVLPPDCAPDCPAEQECVLGVCVPDSPPPIGYVLVPAGSFVMGSPDDEFGRRGDETQRTVTLSTSFYMKSTEVTKGEWFDLVGTTPWSEGDYCEESECPAGRVTWWDALAYCNALSRAEGIDECYELSGCATMDELGEGLECTSVSFSGTSCAGYRLPTEAEWEYACRAESTGATFGGEIAEAFCTPIDPVLDGIGWFCGNSNLRDDSHPVGHKLPNAWGLMDMNGNAGEWVWDWYAPYPERAEVDPSGPNSEDSSVSFRVIRGGNAGSGAYECRSATRGSRMPQDPGRKTGLRPCRSAL